jgi:hypothetical protein
MAARSERDLGVIRFEAYAVMFEERLNRPAASAFYGSPLRSYRRAARVSRCAARAASFHTGMALIYL